MKILDERVQPEVRNLKFPALLLTKSAVRVYPDPEALTAAWKKAVDRKRFDDALLVDSAGRARKVRTVRVLGNIGPFFGFDLYGNRSVRMPTSSPAIGSVPISRPFDRASCATGAPRASTTWIRSTRRHTNNDSNRPPTRAR